MVSHALLAVEPASYTARKTARRNEERLMARKRILLIDADDTRRNTRVAMLTGAGYEVEVRADHIIAENLAFESSFDLVILALVSHTPSVSTCSFRG